MSERPSQKIRRRASRAMLNRAFFDWRSAVVIALTLILTAFVRPFPWWQWWFWLVGGAVAELLLVYSIFADPRVGEQVVAEMLRRTYDLRPLHGGETQEQVEKALEYRARIEGAVQERREGVLRGHLTETARQIDDWIDHIYVLARRLDAYQYDAVIEQDRRAVPLRIENLRAELRREDDPAVRAQIQATLRDKETQWAHLEQLDNAMQKADLQLESTLSALGTVYSQLLLIEARDVDSGRAQRLREEVADQVAALQDVLQAMDEVYTGVDR